jgi:hypothetical protein
MDEQSDQDDSVYSTINENQATLTRKRSNESPNHLIASFNRHANQRSASSNKYIRNLQETLFARSDSLENLKRTSLSQMTLNDPLQLQSQQQQQQQQAKQNNQIEKIKEKFNRRLTLELKPNFNQTSSNRFSASLTPEIVSSSFNKFDQQQQQQQQHQMNNNNKLRDNYDPRAMNLTSRTMNDDEQLLNNYHLKLQQEKAQQHEQQEQTHNQSTPHRTMHKYQKSKTSDLSDIILNNAQVQSSQSSKDNIYKSLIDKYSIDAKYQAENSIIKSSLNNYANNPTTCNF